MSGDASHGTEPLPAAALVTGATGFLGSRLVPRLVSRGVTVTCTTRAADPPPT